MMLHGVAFLAGLLLLPTSVLCQHYLYQNIFIDIVSKRPNQVQVSLMLGLKNIILILLTGGAVLFFAESLFYFLTGFLLGGTLAVCSLVVKFFHQP